MNRNHRNRNETKRNDIILTYYMCFYQHISTNTYTKHQTNNPTLAQPPIYNIAYSEILHMHAVTRDRVSRTAERGSVARPRRGGVGRVSTALASEKMLRTASFPQT